MIEKQSSGGQQVEWTLPFVLLSHLWLLYLVTPLPPQSAWFRCGARFQSGHVIWARPK